MAWDFETEPEFQRELDWMDGFLRDQVDPALKIYVEYSNETWNTIFSQTTYVQDQGEVLALSESRWQAGQRFAALRSIQMWEIFEQEFIDDSRFEKVLATQSSGSSTKLSYL